MANRMTSNTGLLILVILGVVMLQVENTQSANILGMFPLSATSHNNVFSALTKELAARGHHLTIVTPHPIKNPPANYTHIDVSRAVAPHFKAFGKISVVKVLDMHVKLLDVTVSVCEDVLSLPEMKELMDPKKYGKKFDLMLISHFFSECFYPYAEIYDVPVVTMSPAGAFPTTDMMFGNIALPSFVPNAFFSFSDQMTFLERSMNFVSYLGSSIYMKYFIIPAEEKVAKKHFKEISPLTETLKRNSIILLNNHFTYNYPRPLTPNMIEVGGIHVKSPNPLPKDLQKFMDDAKDGVIYFSMGSNLKSSTFSPALQSALMSAFSELRQRVLMKYEADTPIPGQPPNVRLEKWLPQSDLLAHPNMKLFITHGGLLSFQEAVARGVPVIGIPIFGDQEMNMQKVVKLGVGMQVPFAELSKEKLLKAMKEVLGDAKYRNNMKALSNRAMDQPEHPLQRAVFWTEYVMRHKGAGHLKPASLDLDWCQLFMVDVILVLVSIPTVLLFGLYYFVCRCCCGRKRQPAQVPKSKNKDKRQ
ncbi:UDP-glucosyltransferase 2-like [Ischnura elegans]|uniref:UDP-glucosyltransferase 2-like n=1 Tax=Ischnura elegans TaxID=197161 RepID=UPI001ED87519|nr:UDP-glucosyltransferase 2-like [Ischnura elegans]